MLMTSDSLGSRGQARTLLRGQVLPSDILSIIKPMFSKLDEGEMGL